MVQVGIITVDGRQIGTITMTTDDVAEPLVPDIDYNPSGRASDSDIGTGKGFHHHGIGHSRPSHGHEPAGHRHGPGHFPRGEAREKDQQQRHGQPLGDIPYSSSGNPFADERIAKELEANPALREKMAHISLGENQDPRANLAVLETMRNRAIVRGTSLEAQVRRHRSSGKDEEGYYAGYAPHYSSEKKAMFDSNVGKMLKGSNITNYATDNSSGDLAAREKASGAFVHHQTINGDSFFSPGSAQPALRDRWQRLHKQALEHENKAKAAQVEPRMPEDL
jgi:hypothetical protein